MTISTYYNKEKSDLEALVATAGFRETVYEEYIHEVRVGGKYCQVRRKYLNVC